MLGAEVVALLRAGGEPVRALDRAALDVTDGDAVARALAGADVVVSCAAYTAVDAAETDEATAFAVNAVGAQHVARAAARHGARLVHVSTDYVFDGGPAVVGVPYAEDAPLAPRSAYGRTKAAGEWAVRTEHPDALVVRTAWLYGAHGVCFPRTIARVARERGALRGRRRPGGTADVGAGPRRPRRAAGAVRGAGRRLPRHLAGAGLLVGPGPRGRRRGRARPGDRPPVPSVASARPAPRPAWSVLGHEALRRAGVEPVGGWRERWVVAAADVLAGASAPGAHASSSDSR